MRVPFTFIGTLLPQIL